MFKIKDPKFNYEISVEYFITPDFLDGILILKELGYEVEGDPLSQLAIAVEVDHK